MKNQTLTSSISPSPSLLNQNETTQRSKRFSNLMYILALVSMLTTSTVYGLGRTDSQSNVNKPSVTKQATPDKLQYETNRSAMIADMKLM